VDIGIRFEAVEAVLVACEIRSHDNLPIFPVGLVKDPLDEVGPHGGRVDVKLKDIANAVAFVPGFPHPKEEIRCPMAGGADHHRLVVVLL